jgi:hypothetical protein
MQRLALRPWLARTAGVVLTLLVVGAFAPAASAGCGDHVRIVPPPLRQAAPDTPRTDLPAQPLPAPCTGPHCRQAPDAPPLTPSPPPTEQAPACLAASLTLRRTAEWAGLTETPAGRPTSAKRHIYHPPR